MTDNIEQKKHVIGIFLDLSKHLIQFATVNFSTSSRTMESVEAA